ncbi:hypothetical protein K4K55_009562 [Colletotrichum sp. SAR 10_96]|nr:hypothetical protein K4K55_009562 [Colletotrichum sp. SAR 10_96]
MCSKDLICGVACQYSATIYGVNATHSTICVDLPRTTADILFKSIIINQIPTDQKTLSDYRFNDFNDQGKRMLVTLYKHALVYDDISTRELDIWMKDNILFKRMGMQLDLRQHFTDMFSQGNSDLTANMPLLAAQKRKSNPRSPTFDIGLVSANPEVRLQARLRACKNTAENLYHNARAARLHTDQQTFKDFCFDKLTFHVEKIDLLRIYRLLILQMEVSSAELNLWAKEGPPSIGRNIAIEFAHKPDVVPEEYREFFFNNMRIWDLQGNVNLGDHARPARPQRQENPVIIIIDSGDKGGADSNTDKVGITDEHHQTEQASPVAKKASTSKDNGVESQQTGPKKKATPVPYKPRSKIFKRKRKSSSFQPQDAQKSGGFKPSKRKRDDSDSE